MSSQNHKKSLFGFKPDENARHFFKDEYLSKIKDSPEAPKKKDVDNYSLYSHTSDKKETEVR